MAFCVFHLHPYYDVIWVLDIEERALETVLG